MHAISFLTPDEAFLRAAESDPGLELESFLEQVRSDIARGALRASGFRFQEKRMSTVIAPTPPSNFLAFQWHKNLHRESVSKFRRSRWRIIADQDVTAG